MGTGNNVFKPGASAENVNGGSGSTLDFSGSSGVHLALDGSIIPTGWASGDNYYNYTFNKIIGSYTGADILVGDSLNNELTGLGGNDMLSGQDGNDTLNGGLGNDTLDGGSGMDLLYGGDGNDILLGGAGGDSLFGEAGNDTLTGGTGADTLVGGSGADKLVFAAGDFGGTTAGTREQITDFSHTDGDRIDLSAIDANTVLAKDQPFLFIADAAFHNVAGELRYTGNGAEAIVQGDTNGDGKADFELSVLGGVTLVAADFVL